MSQPWREKLSFQEFLGMNVGIQPMTWGLRTEIKPTISANGCLFTRPSSWGAWLCPWKSSASSAVQQKKHMRVWWFFSLANQHLVVNENGFAIGPSVSLSQNHKAFFHGDVHSGCVLPSGTPLTIVTSIGREPRGLEPFFWYLWTECFKKKTCFFHLSFYQKTNIKRWKIKRIGIFGPGIVSHGLFMAERATDELKLGPNASDQMVQSEADQKYEKKHDLTSTALYFNCRSFSGFIFSKHMCLWHFLAATSIGKDNWMVRDRMEIQKTVNKTLGNFWTVVSSLPRCVKQPQICRLQRLRCTLCCKYPSRPRPGAMKCLARVLVIERRLRNQAPHLTAECVAQPKCFRTAGMPQSASFGVTLCGSNLWMPCYEQTNPWQSNARLSLERAPRGAWPWAPPHWVGLSASNRWTR